MMNVLVVSKPGCQPCLATERKLAQLGLNHEIVDMTVDDTYVDDCIALGYQQTPVVLVRNEHDEIIEHWSGYRPDRLVRLVA